MTTDPETEKVEVRTPSPPALDLGDITVNFGGIQALEGLTATVEAGEVTAIIGPNGAGKTTLLNVLSGLLWVNTTGEVKLFGESIYKRPPYAIARMGVGRSFQDPPLLEKESVLENILLGANLTLGYSGYDQLFRPGKVKKQEAAARERVEGIMRMTGILRHAGTPVSELAYGPRKVVDITRALAAEPRLLLLDEPTSGLDSREQGIVRDLLLELHERYSMSILVIEHHMDIVRSVATRVLGLQAGTVVKAGTAGAVLDSAEFRAAVVGSQPTAGRVLSSPQHQGGR